ncbi:hypothetical protein BHM03_00009677 [Ensete ventricosum]|nr:hypothetical protein BHM03_00009677 [Ensete ventricosum]
MSNRGLKKMSSISAWENSKKAEVEAELKKKEVSNFSHHSTQRTTTTIYDAYVFIGLKWKNLLKFKTNNTQEELEKKKAEHAEKVKNKIALIHKEAEEKRAIAEAKRGEEALKAEEKAAKYRATGLTPKRIFGFF